MLATVTDRQRAWRMARMGICALLLTVCRATASAQPVEAFPSDLPVVWQAPQPLEVATAPSMPELDIGVVLFDPGVEDNDDSPAAVVRRLEASLLARELKAALIESNQFGVVRLVPEASALTPVSIHSEILRSDGRDLIIHVTVRDAMSQVWFDHTISHRETFATGTAIALKEVFHIVSNRLRFSWQQYSSRERAQLVAASEVRYAETLVPDAFSGMLNVSPDGWQLNRLPASDDPMLARITRVRNQEYLFCDAIDEQYEELAERVIPTYALWRRATVEQAAWLERYEQRVMDRDDKDHDSRFARMQAQYAAYRSYRIQEQAMYELAEAFENETQPTTLRTVEQVVRLEGTLASQYNEWRRLLRDIFILEQGVL